MTHHENFRAETRAWLDENCPSEMRKHGDVAWGGRNADWSSDDQKLWMERMADKGWTVPTWPKDCGGAGLSKEEDRVLKQEMLGGVQESFDRTLQYLRDREQFGVKIGSFQALKHRAADWFCEVELTRSIVLKALRAIDADSADLATLASAAKARASDVYIHSGEEGVQLYGGIGMTDEEDIGLYLKRARVAELALGDGGYHRDRFARLQGY